LKLLREQAKGRNSRGVYIAEAAANSRSMSRPHPDIVNTKSA
jgi:hypothetical protein